MLIFGLRSTSDDWPGWLMDSNPIRHLGSGLSHPSQAKTHFWVKLLMIWLMDSNPIRHLLQPKKQNACFGLCSNSGDYPGWLMDSNSICHPSPAKKMKRSFLDYVQLLMIGRAGQWTQTPCATPLQPKK